MRRSPLAPDPVGAAEVGARPAWARALGRGLGRGRAAARRLLDGALPPRCPACGVVVGETGVLCAECWGALSFLEPPLCVQCGYPFELDFGEPVACGACLARAPAFDRARAVFAYDEASRSMLLDFKHGDRTDLAPALARWMARAGAELLADADLIAPVPLHPRRLWRRRYNQAALLAQALAGPAEVPLSVDLLQRRRNTPSQGRLSAKGRRRNVAGAFLVRPARRPTVSGKRILLIDDVMTTGATAEACAKALKRAGASGVDLLTLARVVRPTTAE
ncbi:MAG: ComF family protein [Alphaproteobacteria bacterium]|nr:ComF family protein [Alphaproteobacteria bacterium]